MADFTLGQLLTMTRSHAGDTNTTNPGVDSPTIRNFIMEWVQFFKGAFGMEVTSGTAASLAAGAVSGTTIITTGSGPLLIHRVTSDKVAGEMEILSVSKILSLQRSAPGQGVTTKVAIEIQGGTIRSVIIYPHPIPSATTLLRPYFQSAADELATDGSADASLILLTLLEARAVTRCAAADVARLNGRDQQIIEGILRPIDDYMKIVSRLRDTRLRPRSEPEKVAS